MYTLFRHFKWPPSRYAHMGAGERFVIRVFLGYMASELKAEAEEIRKGG
jgi:hypothetical protein